MENNTSMQFGFEQRQQQLHLWLLKQLGLEVCDLKIVSGDASFRRYFRLKHSSGTVIGVDAPPEYENNKGFISIARGFLNAGLKVPEVLVADVNNGFLALSDLGDDLLLSQLSSENVDDWYQQAMRQLMLIQKTTAFPDYLLPAYDEKLLLSEMQLMPDWFLGKHLNVELTSSESKQLQNLFQRLSASALSQPQVTVHRDFHSRNLMVMADQQLAIIDFQDAVTGAISYDLMSLIKDCYIRWPRDLVEQWIKDFHQILVDNKIPDLPLIDEFIFLSDAMAMQRHIKIIGIFSRLNYRDGKADYLQDLPLTLEYIVETAERYEEFSEFANWLKDKIIPAFNQRQLHLGLNSL